MNWDGPAGYAVVFLVLGGGVYLGALTRLWHGGPESDVERRFLFAMRRWGGVVALLALAAILVIVLFG